MGWLYQPALIREAVAVLVGKDEVIQQIDAQQLTGFAQTLGERTILLARRHVTGGVVMRADPSRSTHQD